MTSRGTSYFLVPMTATSHDVWQAVGEHDCFFPPERLAVGTRSPLGREPHIVARAGHLLGEERPDAVVDMVAELF
jgi:pimeloyl-ACP methyl ester carboxylesterase